MADRHSAVVPPSPRGDDQTRLRVLEDELFALKERLDYELQNIGRRNFNQRELAALMDELTARVVERMRGEGQ